MMDFGGKEILGIKDWSRWTQIELHSPKNEITSDLLEKEYGIDPLSGSLTKTTAEEILTRRGRSGVKGVLMDQKEFAGIGNAYADEILWEARIHP